ncbi:GNAT family N-acetyltransferase [Ancylobacter terrae]|uniref:GNAT family N-acetyltransferase n=1 Tax=Ancylobacter sp. sgz301288 TaxID=3342077 RepID=UPI00385E3828
MSARGAYRARWADAAEMETRVQDWRALAARAAEPNVFADPDYVLPALRHLGGAGVRFLIVERVGDAAAELAGVLPLRLTRTRWGVPLRLALHHLPYAPHGAPLVDGADTPAICAALIEALAAGPAPAALLLPHLVEDGAFAAALRLALQSGGRRIARFEPFARAAMKPAPAERAGYLAEALSKHRRRRLEGQRRKLEAEGGPVVTEIATGTAVSAALERFLALEAAGWKGARGTAAGRNESLAAFFRDSTARLAARGRAEVIELRQAPDTVAVGVLLRDGPQAWFYKTAYDERLARHSPGVLLDLAASAHLLADPGITVGDSLATVSDPYFERMWRERLPMADWLVEITPADNRFALARWLEGLRRRLRARLKASVLAFRQWRGRP